MNEIFLNYFFTFSIIIYQTNLSYFITSIPSLLIMTSHCFLNNYSIWRISMITIIFISKFFLILSLRRLIRWSFFIPFVFLRWRIITQLNSICEMFHILSNKNRIIFCCFSDICDDYIFANTTTNRLTYGT